MPLLSWIFAGETLIASGKPYLSTARWILMPLIFLPPSKPRAKQLGADCQDRLSMMTALGTGFSPATLPPGQDQGVEQAAPQAEPGPAGEQGVQRAEWNVAELANRPP